VHILAVPTKKGARGAVLKMKVLVREMLPSERVDVEGLFSSSLGLVDRIGFQLSFENALKDAQKQRGGCLVAVLDGQIVGSVSLRFQRIGGERTGFIDALIVGKALRVQGIGRSLVDSAILWLEAWECAVIYATVDRYNSPSWNIFVHRDFSVYEITQQVMDYRLNFLRLWLAEFHFLGYGTFFLRRTRNRSKPRETDEVWHFMAAWVGVSLTWWIHALRDGQPSLLLPFFFVVVGLSLMAHELPQKLIGRHLGWETTFKAWGSGLFFSSLLAIVGSFFPAYGSTYVKQLDWRYTPTKKETGIFFAIGPSVSLVLAFVFWVLSHITNSGLLTALGTIGYTMNLVTVIFNLIPVQAAGGLVWDGKKIFAWNKTVWTTLVTTTSALIILDAFF
jgi:Zn-dependent protease/predicted N-acetyltransferase YhbS